MIEGIDYYPKRRKINPKFKYLVLLLIVILVITFWYFDDEQNLETLGSRVIIINDPKIDPIINAIPIAVKPSAQIEETEPEILENLDEVIPIYNP